MNLRVETQRFVKGLLRGLTNDDNTRTMVPYREFVTLMCQLPSSFNATSSNMLSGVASLNRTGIDSSLGGGILGSGPPAISRRTLTPQELLQEDIAAATAAARTVHAAADQMSMLRNENQRLRKELSSFNVSKHLHVLLFFLLLFTVSIISAPCL